MPDTRPYYEGDNIMAARYILPGDWWDLETYVCTCGAALQVTHDDGGDRTVACPPCAYEFPTDEDGLIYDRPRATQPATN